MKLTIKKQYKDALKKALNTDDRGVSISTYISGIEKKFNRYCEGTEGISVERSELEGMTPLKISKLLTSTEEFKKLFNSFSVIDFNEVQIMLNNKVIVELNINNSIELERNEVTLEVLKDRAI